MTNPDPAPLAEWEKALLEQQYREGHLDLIHMLAAELALTSRHFGRFRGIVEHDRRMPDGSCFTCALLDEARSAT